MKIHIIGCSGSGKTHLAKQLSEELNIPHFDLDEIMWDNSSKSYGVKRTEDVRKQMLQNILMQPNWIIEGVYYAWCREVFEEADQIYLLNVPRYKYRYRLVKRFFRRKLGLESGKKETFKSLWNLLRWTDKWQKVNLVEIRSILLKYPDKVIEKEY